MDYEQNKSEFVEGVENNTDDTTAPEELGVVEMSLAQKNIPHYYGGSSISIYDVIVAVRERYPNPWQKVILDCDARLPLADLEALLIFLKGRNDDKVNGLAGITSTAYLPVKIDEETAQHEDFGIQAKTMEFQLLHNITNFELLIYGEDQELLSRCWDYLRDSDDVPQRAHFPRKLSSVIQKFPNGFDIAPVAREMAARDIVNELSTMVFKEQMDIVRNEVRKGNVLLQNSEDSFSKYAKWILLCVTQEFDLTPVYTRSYLGEYLLLEAGYPFSKLSMNERINFIDNLPDYSDRTKGAVGYIGNLCDFYCQFRILQKNYPHPTIAYDVKSGRVIMDPIGLEMFELDRLELTDWRQMFQQSKKWFITSDPGLVGGRSDMETDIQLSNIFTQMMMASGLENAFLSVRNCVYAKAEDGRDYVVYFNDQFGLTGIFMSPYFGYHPFILPEKDFKHLIDVKYILALMRAEQNPQSSRKAVMEIMTTAASTLKPAIPPFVLACSELTSEVNNLLSYYDRRLRRDRQLCPVVTHIDSGIKHEQGVFDYISYQSAKRDSIASAYISSFGTLNSGNGNVGKLPVSIETFRGTKLL